MKIVKSVAEMKNLSLTYHKCGQTIGFVPTMGALHEGHLSLLKIAGRNSDITVMSIFVNPTQFGPQEDFEKYPRVFEQDCAKALDVGCDVLFVPTVSQMYPDGFSTYVSVEGITSKLCGISRPSHFRGVTTVVLKFFNIVEPQIAVFGQKDAQQVLVIKRMVRDLNCPVKILTGPIIREPDGFAISSRNKYLTDKERSEVPQIFEGLKKIMENYDKGEKNAGALKEILLNKYHSLKHIKMEYADIVDFENLKPLEILNTPSLVAVACRTTESKTRLIDNIVLGGVL